MLEERRIPLTDAEHEAINELLGEDTTATLTRRDPGESGPVLVHTETDTYEVGQTGKVTRLEEN